MVAEYGLKKGTKMIDEMERGERMGFMDVKIHVPAGMVMYLQNTDTRSEMERNAMILYPYIKNGVISHGKAAEILGVSKYDLIMLYDQMGLAYLSMDISEIEAEVADWERLKGKQV